MAAVKFTKKRKRFDRRQRLVRRNPSFQYKIDWFEGKNSHATEISLFLETLNFGGAKSTDSRSMGIWTDGWMNAQTFLKHAFFEIPFRERNPKKKE